MLRPSFKCCGRASSVRVVYLVLGRISSVVGVLSVEGVF